jgi:muramoyltetrapeptide carboxypeptidase
MNLNKLTAIKSGTKVGLVSPAGPVTKNQLKDGLKLLSEKGILYEFGEHSFLNAGIVSAKPEYRLSDINSFLSRQDIHAVWALRGGYGSMQLFNKFNYELLGKHPKLFIGFSDLTALQWGLFKKCKMPSLSGFTITSQFNTKNSYLATGLEILSGERNSISQEDIADTQIRTICEGEAEGILLGGTLSMICALCGTPYFVNESNLILFIEDVNEPLYRIDRSFQQLALMGFWKKVNGVILGKFLSEDNSVDVVPLIQPHLQDGIPVIADFPYCHQTNCMLLPQGVFARLVAEPFMLSWEPFLF